MKTFEKAPGAKLDYQWDWSDWLGLDTISQDDVTFIAPENLVIEEFTVADGKVTAWISGGEINTTEIVTCRIETAEGRKNEKSARFEIIPT